MCHIFGVVGQNKMGTDLAKCVFTAHIRRMATQAPQTKPVSRYAGRSALTGLLVLKPRSKGATVTAAQVRAAIKRVQDRK